jgi:hypothetical protein
MAQAPAVFTPTLTAVQSKFASWRTNKKHCSRIPEALWDAAAMLCKEHSLCKVSTALSLSYTELKKRAQAQRNQANLRPDFMSIDIAPGHSAECLVEMEHHNGNKMRMHFKGKADLDLQSFAESFWGKRG